MKKQSVYKISIFACIFLIQGISLHAQSQADLDTAIFAVVEQMPQYPGGFKEFEKYVLERLNMEPVELAMRDRVQVVFVINKTGSVQNARIGRGQGVNPEVDKEIIRVVEQSPKWIPGKQRGVAVYVRTSVPLPIEKTKTKLE